MRSFTTAPSSTSHPMANGKNKTKRHYYQSLEYFVKAVENSEYTEVRLRQYRKFLLKNNAIVPPLNDKELDNVIRVIVNNFTRTLRRKYRYWLVCDIALVLNDEEKFNKAYALVKGFLNPRQASLLDKLYSILWDEKELFPSVAFTAPLLVQFRKNRHFEKNREKRFIVTANMSAGKSTLINAIAGKALAQTSQEACTNDICYLYNKPFEDDIVSLSAPQLNLEASHEELAEVGQSEKNSIVSYFRTYVELRNRICIIDTPGVNSAINREHGRITRKALVNERYDKVIYLLNANKLGTDDEIRHLKWVAKHVPTKKIIFALNKIDDFNSDNDSIEQSVDDARKELMSLGFGLVKIYPLSAYCAYLVKLQQNGDPMTEDEADMYALYAKKFSRPTYDLSPYYKGVRINDEDDQTVRLSKQCGIYGLELILFGGTI